MSEYKIFENEIDINNNDAIHNNNEALENETPINKLKINNDIMNCSSNDSKLFEFKIFEKHANQKENKNKNK